MSEDSELETQREVIINMLLRHINQAGVIHTISNILVWIRCVCEFVLVSLYTLYYVDTYVYVLTCFTLSPINLIIPVLPNMCANSVRSDSLCVYLYIYIYVCGVYIYCMKIKKTTSLC